MLQEVPTDTSHSLPLLSVVFVVQNCFRFPTSTSDYQPAIGKKSRVLLTFKEILRFTPNITTFNSLVKISICLNLNTKKTDSCNLQQHVLCLTNNIVQEEIKNDARGATKGASSKELTINLGTQRKKSIICSSQNLVFDIQSITANYNMPRQTNQTT